MTKQEKEEQHRIEQLDRLNRLKSINLGVTAKEATGRITNSFQNVRFVELFKPLVSCLEIKFEAFGQVHTTFTEHENIGLIYPTIEKICGTVFIHEPVCNTLVSLEVFDNNNLKHIKAWNEKIVNLLGEEID